MNTNVPEWDFWQLVGGLVGISMLLMIVLLTVWWFAFRTKQNKKLKVRPLPASPLIVTSPTSSCVH
jgi:hypothetical protein